MVTKAKKRTIIGGTVIGVVLLAIIIVGSLFIEKVPAGTVGVVYNINGVEETPLPQGWHLLAPFDKVVEYPVKTQTATFNDIKIATSDGKNISVGIAFNYYVDSTKAVDLYNKFGAVSVDSIANSYLRTRLRDASRQVVSQYSVIDIYGEKSSEAQAEIQEIFAEDVGKLGFVVEGLTLGVPKADKATQDAIDARVKASQELEKKNTEIETAKKEAERMLIEAKGIADYNKIISESLTPELIDKQAIEKWDGKLPQVTGSEGMMIQVPNANK